MIKYGDLEYVIHDTCEFGMYEPKTGSSDEMVVLSFRVREEDCLKEMCFFIEYIPLTTFISASHSTFPDDEGYYSVFVELSADEKTFDEALKVAYQVYNNLAASETLRITVYPNTTHEFKISDLREKLKK